jgi:hypothetical protein
MTHVWNLNLDPIFGIWSSEAGLFYEAGGTSWLLFTQWFCSIKLYIIKCLSINRRDSLNGFIVT